MRLEPDVRFLLDSRSSIQGMLGTASADQLDEPAAILAMLSSRMEIWEPFVLAAGVAAAEDHDPWRVIESFGRGELDSIRQLDAPVGLEVALRQEFEGDAQFVLRAVSQEAFVAAFGGITRLEDCMKRGGTREEILDCLRHA